MPVFETQSPTLHRNKKIGQLGLFRLIINDINEDNIHIDQELTTSEFATDEDIIIKDVMACSTETDNDNDELYGDFVTLPS